MTRKDYILLAKVIRGLVGDGALALDDERDCRSLVDAFVTALKAENDRFDTQKFYKACGVETFDYYGSDEDHSDDRN